jgi:hypothetical protein
MIAIFGDSRQFSANKIGAFTKNTCYDPVFKNTSSFLNKNGNFEPIFSAKRVFKNQNIGPCTKLSSRTRHHKQGCQMVCFQTKNPKYGKFWRAFQ